MTATWRLAEAIAAVLEGSDLGESWARFNIDFYIKRVDDGVLVDDLRMVRVSTHLSLDQKGPFPVRPRRGGRRISDVSGPVP